MRPISPSFIRTDLKRFLINAPDLSPQILRLTDGLKCTKASQSYVLFELDEYLLEEPTFLACVTGSFPHLYHMAA